MKTRHSLLLVLLSLSLMAFAAGPKTYMDKSQMPDALAFLPVRSIVSHPLA